MTSDVKHTVEVGAIAAAGNTAAWSLQDTSYIAAIFVSVITGVWVLVQMLRFIQKWMREEEARNMTRDAKTTKPAPLGD